MACGEPGWFQLPTGHHTRWFCERTAKVGENWDNSDPSNKDFDWNAVKIARYFLIGLLPGLLSLNGKLN